MSEPETPTPASVTELPRPYRLTPEMIVRYYLSRIDQLEDIIVAARFKDGTNPLISISSDTHHYFEAFVSCALARAATADLGTKKPATGAGSGGQGA